MKSIAVCGLGRCGSSLMMQMLEAGGVECIGRFPAFEEPEFYHEGAEQKIQQIADMGKAVKILDPQRFPHVVPALQKLDVIWMRRQFHQQARSQVKMLRYLGGSLMPTGKEVCGRMKKRLVHDHGACMDLFRVYNVRPLMLYYEEVLQNTLSIACTVESFLGRPLDIDAMVMAVRKKDPRCAADLQMEEQLAEVVG